ncbi:MAG TPA: bifunctional tRNA (5-methylaminomethyl-2-thiouridine)(34)-methyltransferase MnmD/FAD-dependent 5-carboxymethylaminomethyl-2-thiouridine(34) oxidoreductase MnmC [Methyloradius sp.]
MTTKIPVFTQANYAPLQWKDKQPFSGLYGDVYFSSDSGLDESRYVFLTQNHLKQRWPLLNGGIFTIAETGFGTGLNFLCAWELWNEVAPAETCLHFISFEKHPIALPDLKKALSLWSQLAALSDQLCQQYQWITPGWHRLIFAKGRVTLTLIIGDIADTMPLVKARVDAWFLDGFAPAKNPEMWQPMLFEQMARLSISTTTFATFTSAGVVKRGLLNAGFSVNKIPGYGRKREMLAGLMPGHSGSLGKQKKNNQHAIVIGAGIAGSATAYALANRGWQVTLIDRHPAIAQEASGNPVGIIYPRLTGQDTAMHKLALSGYLHTIRLIQTLNLSSSDFSACGVLQLAFDAQELKRCLAVAARNLPDDTVRYVDETQASGLAGTALSHPGLFFPAAGWVNPVALCHALTKNSLIHKALSCDVQEIRKKDGNWQVWRTNTHGNQLQAEAPVLILANANEANKFSVSSHLCLQAVRGQISLLPHQAGVKDIKTVICTDGYISPSANGQNALGATFSPNDIELDVRDTDHQANLNMLKKMAPQFHQDAQAALQSITGRAALRAATIDYLPMAGPLLDHHALIQHPPRHNIDATTFPWLEGLYVNAGHGSKGLTQASVCAEMIAASISGEPAPVDAKLLAALDPNRFLLRKMGLKALVQGLAAYPLLH